MASPAPSRGATPTRSPSIPEVIHPRIFIDLARSETPSKRSSVAHSNTALISRRYDFSPVLYRIASPRQRSPVIRRGVLRPNYEGGARPVPVATEQRRFSAARWQAVVPSVAAAAAPPVPAGRIAANRHISAHVAQSTSQDAALPAWHNPQEPLMVKKVHNGEEMYNLILTAPHQLPSLDSIPDPEVAQPSAVTRSIPRL